MNRGRQILKIDAVEQLFPHDVTTTTWAVIDSGIDQDHPAFRNHDPTSLTESRVRATINVARGLAALNQEPDSVVSPLVSDDHWRAFLDHAIVNDEPWQPRAIDTKHDQHGTHVAGIIGADARDVDQSHPSDLSSPLPREIRGMHPTVQLVDINIYDDAGRADEFSVIVALSLIRWLNEGDRASQMLQIDGRIHGVNMSLSVPFDGNRQACGWTPVCQEVDRLSSSGVVVVAAAGNFGWDATSARKPGRGYRLVSITDPGNAECAITVGATDPEYPYRFGPLGLSSRGPTADGRHKPDLLAPGRNVLGPAAGGGWVLATGTSQAAAHVSGVASRLLARFPELIGQPERVKDGLRSSASDLGRLPDFQGAGLVDALRAMQWT